MSVKPKSQIAKNQNAFYSPDPSFDFSILQTGVGDLITLNSLRLRWNTFANDPELCSGYQSQINVNANTRDVLRFDDGNTDVTFFGATDTHKSNRLISVASWAKTHRLTTLLNAEEYAGRLRSVLSGGVGAFSHGYQDVLISDLQQIAETSSVVTSFTGKVVEAQTNTSRERRRSYGGASTRPLLWVAQDSSGLCVEVSLAAVDWKKASALMSDIPGQVVVLNNFIARRRTSATGVVTFGLVEREEVVVIGDEDGVDAIRPGDTRPRDKEQQRQKSTWRVLTDGEKFKECLQRCQSRRASIDVPSLKSIKYLDQGFEGDSGRVCIERNQPVKRRRLSNQHDPSVVVVKARVAWVRLPVAKSSLGKRKSNKSATNAIRTNHTPVTATEIFKTCIAFGCLKCFRVLVADKTEGMYRQCTCHDGKKNAVGKIWRSLEIGLVEEGGEESLTLKLMQQTQQCDDPDVPKTRVAIVDASLVQRLLLGARADLCTVEENSSDASMDETSDEAFFVRNSDSQEKQKVNHASLAAAAINALAAGAERNKTPFTWRVRVPPPDRNGVLFEAGKPLEVVDFDIE